LGGHYLVFRVKVDKDLDLISDLEFLGCIRAGKPNFSPIGPSFEIVAIVDHP
jgi:hypothetical protein